MGAKADLAKSGEGESMQMFAPSSVNMQTLGASYTYTPGDNVAAFKIESAVDIKVYIDADAVNYWVIKANVEAGPYAICNGVYQFVVEPVAGGGQLSFIEMKRLVN
jgi:hypothetical protein